MSSTTKSNKSNFQISEKNSLFLPNTTLYVGDLSLNVSETELHEIFSKCGPIIFIRLFKNVKAKNSLNYAYIKYKNYEDAEEALQCFNHTMIKGQTCRIMWCQRNYHFEKNTQGNLYVKNISENIDNKTFYELFSRYGNVLSCKVVPNSFTTRGFGFVQYETQEEANKAIKKLNDRIVDGLKLFVGPFLSKNERTKDSIQDNNPYNLYVKNLPNEFNEKELKRLFSKYGIIQSCVVMPAKDTRSKKFGFVCFETKQMALKAIDELNKIELSGEKIFVCKAEKKEERAEKLKRLFSEKNQKFNGVCVYVKNLDERIEENQLRLFFMNHGMPRSVKIIRDVDTNKSKGEAIIVYSHISEALLAISETNGAILFETKLSVCLVSNEIDGKPLLCTGKEQLDSSDGSSKLQSTDIKSPENQSNYSVFCDDKSLISNHFTNKKNLIGLSNLTEESQNSTVLTNENESSKENRTLEHKIYLMVIENYSKQATKITERILEMPDTELLNLLKTPEILREKIRNTARLIID